MAWGQSTAGIRLTAKRYLRVLVASVGPDGLLSGDGLPSRIRLPRRRASHQELPTAAVKLVGACHEGSSGHLPRDQELPTLLHCKILQLRVDDVSTHVSENEKFRLAAP